MPCSMCFRSVISAATRSLNVTGDEPGGPERHFCKPADAMSICQASISNGLPPSDAVQST